MIQKFFRKLPKRKCTSRDFSKQSVSFTTIQTPLVYWISIRNFAIEDSLHDSQTNQNGSRKQMFDFRKLQGKQTLFSVKVNLRLKGN